MTRLPMRTRGGAAPPADHADPGADAAPTLNGDARGARGLGECRLEFVWVQPSDDEEEARKLRARADLALKAVAEDGEVVDAEAEHST